jgi:RimJ/RimL family protein N-acetyltransferase
MTVRPATAADARAIADVHVRTWQAAYVHAFPPEVLAAITVDEREALWRRLLADEDVQVWVAEAEDDVVGFASAGEARDEEDVAELYAIYVLPDAWGGGAAHELMHAVIGWFLAEEYTTAVLWVLADNPRARRFYEREGWRADGERVETIRGVAVQETRYHLTLVGA